ncbi:mavicyanin-like, partial [Trifolium medium]|nr:mavicyanin-like [Trifolium medium]
MALVERAMFLSIVMMMVAMQISYAAVYKVGDSAGWTTLGNINYKKWSATKNFQIGDII